MEKAQDKEPKKRLRQKFFAAIASIGGILTGGLGIIGSAGWCCIPWIAGILGIFGISSMFLIAYSRVFIITGILLIGLSLILFLRRKKECSTK